MRVSECMHKAMRAAKHALANDPFPWHCRHSRDEK